MANILKIVYANGSDAPDVATHWPDVMAAGNGDPPHCNWATGSSPGTNGLSGNPGQKGAHGVSGSDAPWADDVFMNVDTIIGTLGVQRSGGRGGKGARGGAGGPGQPGGNGAAGCSSGAFSQPATGGGRGGDGGDAGDGGDGGKGANGGNVIVSYQTWTGGPNLQEAPPDPADDPEGFVLGSGGLGGGVGDPGAPGPGGTNPDTGVRAADGQVGRVAPPPGSDVGPKNGATGRRSDFPGELIATPR